VYFSWSSNAEDDGDVDSSGVRGRGRGDETKRRQRKRRKRKRQRQRRWLNSVKKSSDSMHDLHLFLLFNETCEAVAWTRLAMQELNMENFRSWDHSEAPLRLSIQVVFQLMFVWHVDNQTKQEVLLQPRCFASRKCFYASYLGDEPKWRNCKILVCASFSLHRLTCTAWLSAFFVKLSQSLQIDLCA
jgi:hypothetical protein